MQPGYLYIETHADHPALVRVATTHQPPAIPAEPPRRIRYIARFDDPPAGRMHLHQLLRRRLVDPDRGLYRSDLPHAVAAADSLGLPHQRTYLDAMLETAVRRSIEARSRRLAAARRRRERAWDRVGYAAALWLVLCALSGPI